MEGTSIPIDQPNNDKEIPIEQIPFETNETSFFAILVQMFGALIVVIALIYILLRFVNLRTRAFRSNQTIQNIGGVPLGTNRSVQMVKIGDELLILGVGDSIQLLKEIKDKDEIERLLENQKQELEKIDEPIMKLGHWISKNLLKKRNKETHNELEFSEILKKQLKDVSASQQKIYKAIKEHNK